MGYYLDKYDFLILFPSSILCFFALLGGFLYLSFWIAKRFKLSDKRVGVLTGTAILLAVLGFVWMLREVPALLNDGKVRRVYLITEGETRLVVWFTREDPDGMSSTYAHQIKSFDLATGETRGHLKLSRGSPYNDYFIHGPFGSNAWGYSSKTGLTYLDMYKAELIADKAAIMRRNPVLADGFKLVEANQFDAVTHGAYVYIGTGAYYRVNPGDLKATAEKEIDYTTEKHDKEHCLLCQHDAQFGRVSDNTSGWTFDGDNKTVLIFRDKAGTELNRIDLVAHFNKRAYLLALAYVNDEALLMITEAGYTLTVLRSDPKTGKILGQTDIF